MRDVVGNARGGTLDALEAFGWQTREELAERVGYSRPRDLERKHLRPLAEMGLVESRDGRWGVAHDYADAQAGIAELNPERIRREYSSSEGRTVSTVEFLMSSVERDRRAERGVRESRERFAEYLKNTSPEADDACRELLNEMEREREHLEAEIRRVAAADGTTGEIEPADLYRRLVLAGINAKHADRHLESLGFDPAWIPGLDSPVSEGHPDGSLTEQKATGRVA
jgi:DNA-binding transcriptional ArsR family regulator